MMAAATFATASRVHFGFGRDAAEFERLGEIFIHAFLDAVNFLLGANEVCGQRIVDDAFALGLKVINFLVTQANALLLLVIQLFAPFNERLIFLFCLFVREKSVDVFANVLEIGMIQDGLAKLPCFLCDTVIFRC